MHDLAVANGLFSCYAKEDVFVQLTNNAATFILLRIVGLCGFCDQQDLLSTNITIQSSNE